MVRTKGAGGSAPQAEALPRRSDLPGWPRGMRQDWAAAYVGLSSTTFRIIARDDGIPVVRITQKRIIYLREDLDAWLDRKAGARPTILPQPVGRRLIPVTS